MKADRSDLRMARTRGRLLAAFSELARRHRYESITVRDIVATAEVSRSTFYEHFSGKDNLLASSIGGMFGVLADMVVCEDISRLTSLLDHFRDYGALTRELLNGAAGHKVRAVLARQIGTRLKAHGRGTPRRLLLPPRLAALQLAGMILATVAGWLNGEGRCDSATLARGLRRACEGTLAALYTPGNPVRAR